MSALVKLVVLRRVAASPWRRRRKTNETTGVSRRRCEGLIKPERRRAEELPEWPRQLRVRRSRTIKRSCHQAATLAAVEPSAVAA